MSPPKKQPRPVTRWFTIHRGGDLGAIANGTPMVNSVRCRVTPLRRPSEWEISRLGKALGKASGLHEMDQVRLLYVIRNIARAAWRRGAR